MDSASRFPIGLTAFVILNEFSFGKFSPIEIVGFQGPKVATDANLNRSKECAD